MHIDRANVPPGTRTLLHRLLTCERMHHLHVFAAPTANDAIAVAKAFLLDFLGVPWPKTHDPDFLELQSSGKVALHSISAIRDLLEQLSLAPYGGKGRGVLIESADRMLAPAANALLKILEEPPPKTIIILATDAPQKLLPTILSRAQILRLPSHTQAVSPYLHHVDSLLCSLEAINFSLISQVADRIVKDLEKQKSEFLSALTIDRVHAEMTAQARAEVQHELDGSAVLWTQTQSKLFLEALYLSILGRNHDPILRASAPPQTLVQLLLQALDGIDRGASLSDMFVWFFSQAVRLHGADVSS